VARLLGFAISVGGLLIAVLVVAAWLLVRPASRAARALLAAIAVFYTVLSTYPLPHAVARRLSGAYPPLARGAIPAGRTALVLLGSGSYTEYDWAGGRAAVLDPHGLARTLEAARAYRLIDPAWVICSGGVRLHGDPEPLLSETMTSALVRLGVPAARIISRDGAGDTHDEAVMVKQLLPTLHVDHIVLVTSGYHMPRAFRAFRAMGIGVIPAPARDDVELELTWHTKYLPSARGMQEALVVAHELLGFVYYRLRGWH